MINFFEKVSIFLPPFDTSQIRELRIVKGKYIKYKLFGKWYKAEITNFDRYSEPSYKCLEAIVENLFEEVKRAVAKVPIICRRNNSLYYLPNSFGGKEIFAKDKILIAEKLNPIFSKRYPKLDCSTSQFLAFHLGDGSMFFHYEDKSPEESGAEELVEDIKRLHRLAFINKLSREEIQKVFKEYYKDLFPEILVVPEIQTPPEIKVEEAKVTEEEVKVEEKGLEAISEYVAKEKKRKRTRKEKKEVEEISIEKIKQIPYERIVEVINNYNPETSDFFGRAAKIDYENEISKIKNPDKKKEMDYLLYFFIVCSEKMNKREAYLKFKEEVKNFWR